MKINIDYTLQRWDGEGGWFFTRLPKDTYNDLQEIGKAGGRGFGAIKVKVTIGMTSWETSVFPDTENKSYLLFIKKAVRTKEKLELGDQIKALVELKT